MEGISTIKEDNSFRTVEPLIFLIALNLHTLHIIFYIIIIIIIIIITLI